MDGIINLEKPSGMSSQSAVSALKRLFHDKAGHCGTLDPMASGVLPVCLGRATRLSQYIMGQRKEYIAEVVFGIETDSYDADGAVLFRKDASHITCEQVTALFPALTGEIMQRPPAVSALKQGGEALYKKVRRGEAVETPARPVMIYGLELLDFTPGEHPVAKILVACGQGAYIRSLAHDMGESLNVGASLISLRRTVVGEFKVEKAYSIPELEAMTQEERNACIISMDDAVAHLPVWQASRDAVMSLAHGNSVPCAEELPETPLRVKYGDTLIGIGFAAEEMINMDLVLVDQNAFDDLRSFTVLAAGTFDGLHLGHRALFREARRLKQELGGNLGALTFDIHPLQLITGKAPEMLTTGDVKKDIIRRGLRADGIAALHFDEAMRDMDPRAFVEEILIKRYDAKAVVVGFNYSFGMGGKGTPELLREICTEHGVTVSVVDEVTCEYGSVSSTNIRRHLKEGDMTAVNSMLGYWFMLDVKRGEDGLYQGRAGQALPKDGVYAARMDDGDGVQNGSVCVSGGRLALYPLNGEELSKKVRLYIGDGISPESTKEDLEAYFSQISQKKHLPKPLN